ncbi:phytase [Bowmanella sp. Y26]|uniref:phytase n=1 Tax=Bowmanella yangjiangensis TaxID=2811230 RepID=UPI001BDDB276|nr:phytase [Bowmanella yangjiangensis]MBT1066176.1 phytase [Bowmanella yangjiangensis]
MKKYLSALTLALVTGGASATDAVLQTVPFYQAENLQGQQVQPLVHGSSQFWLITSESRGLMLLDEQKKVRASFAGNFETLAWQPSIQVGDTLVDLVIGIDNESAKTQILALDWQKPELRWLSDLSPQDAQLETLCVYAHPQSGHLSLFSIDVQGMAHERLIYDAKRRQLVDVQVRNFPGVLNAKDCVADTASANLYVAEENVGVWRYPASMEADPVREPVAMLAPFGDLQGEITDLALVDDGALLVISPKARSLSVYSEDAEAKHWQISGVKEPEAVGVQVEEQRLQLTIYDEGQDAYVSAKVSGYSQASKGSYEEIAVVSPSAQTTPVARFGDAADDPAIWLNSNAPEQSRILGTDKRVGLMVYGLDGSLLQSLPVGRLNNVDVRHGFSLNGKTLDLAVASNRTLNSISLFGIDPLSGHVSHLLEAPTSLTEVYGLCMYQSGTGTYVFINDTDGRFQQYRITEHQRQLEVKLVREFAVASQPEGCVADDVSGMLYLGEEAAGIWRTQAEPKDASLEKMATTGELLHADVEGMGIYRQDQQAILVVSSQGNDSYLAYALEPDFRYLGRFRIGLDLQKGLDGVSETDGLEVSSASFGAEYPKGMLVVQDGRNQMPGSPQNFKIVDWRDVELALKSQFH